MSQLVNYSIIEAGLRALADKAHESAVAQAEGKSISSFEKYVHDGKIPEGIHDQFGHEKKWNKSLIRYFANKKAFFHKLSRKYGINI